MASDSRKNIKVNASVTVLLMFCIVMFIGSLYYLAVMGPWSVEKGFTSHSIQPVLLENDTDEPESIYDALQHFIDTNCTIVSFNFDTSKYKIHETSFHEIYSKALYSRVLIITEIEGKTVLTIIEKGCLLRWNP